MNSPRDILEPNPLNRDAIYPIILIVPVMVYLILLIDYNDDAMTTCDDGDLKKVAVDHKDPKRNLNNPNRDDSGI